MSTNPEVILKLNLEKINIIISGLRELPMKIAEPMIADIVKQAESQLNPPTENEVE